MKSYLATREFWFGALERAIRAFAWAFIAALGVPNVGGVVGIDVLHIGWRDAASLAAGGFLLSMLFSVASGSTAIGPAGSPSLVDDRPAKE